MGDLNELLQKANQHDSAGEFTQAAEIYGKLLTLAAPEVHGKLHLYHGVSLLNSGDATGALGSFEKAIESADEAVLSNAWGGKARALERSNQLEDACAAYETSLNLDPKGQFVKWAEFGRLFFFHFLKKQTFFQRIVATKRINLRRR